MTVKNVELFTCDDCKNLILIEKGGVHFHVSSGGERVRAKWAGGFAIHGPVPEGHTAPPAPAPKNLSTGPFEGIDSNATVTLCRKCIAKRFGFKDESEEEAPKDPNAEPVTRFNHNEPV